MTPSRHNLNRNPAAQQTPDLMLANPLCCYPGLGERMQFGQANRREVTTPGARRGHGRRGARSSRPDQIRGRNLYGIGDDVGPVRYKRIRRRWSRSKSRR
jgi:hypothetical protein